MGSRGPPPKSLVKLFWLLNEDPHVSTLELSNCLDVEPETICRYRRKLQKNLSAKRISFDRYCPECFIEALWRDPENGEVVCKSCGAVLKKTLSENHSLPFDETFQPSNSLAFGKGLGSNLSYGSTYRVLAKVHNKKDESKERQQIPIRQIRTLTETTEPKPIETMLAYGSSLLKRLGLHRDGEKYAILSDALGRVLRTVGAVLLVSKMDEQIQPYLLVRAATYLVLSKCGFSQEAKICREKYGLNEKAMKLLLKIEELVKLSEEDLETDGLRLVGVMPLYSRVKD